MAPLTPQTLGSAIRQACKTAGITQKQIAEAVDRDQSTVSDWLKGEIWPPLWALPIVDELCRQPRGHVLRLAGYVDDEGGGDVLAAIAADGHIREDVKANVADLYRSFRRNFPR